MENLHPEITLDIMSRLPVESVLECRRVCKPWRTLLHYSNPAFAHLHLRRQLLQLDDDDEDDDPRQVGMFYLIWLDDNLALDDDHDIKTVTRTGLIEENGLLLYYGVFDENDEQSYQTITRIIHPPVGLAHSIVGSCNGLICLGEPHPKYNIYDPVYICNPITREFVNLPRFNNNDTIRKMLCGFGYHPSSNEYKVVRIFYEREKPVGQVQVYTLGGGSGWRNKGEIDFALEIDSLTFMGIYVNGALHWVDGFKILSFDLADEEFRLLPSPPCLVHDENNSFLLKELGGYLSIVHRKKGEFVDIWSLKEPKKSRCYDVKEQEYQSWSWKKEHNIAWEGMLDDDYEPFALTKRGKVLLWYNLRFLSVYDPETAALKKLVDHGQGLFSFQSIIHMNSFVSLKSLGEDTKIIGSVEGV